MLKRFHRRPIIFAGSSLQLVTPDIQLRFDVRPPAKRGDLAACLNQTNRFHRILLADGVFGSEMSVSPHECREVIEAGHVLMGCSSMGALRAADCKDVGMIGFGNVFLGFVTGYYKSDADVAVVYNRESRTELALSFVHCDGALRNLLDQKQISQIEYRMVHRELHQISWTERFLPQALQAAAKFISPMQVDLLKTNLTNPALDPKKTDCLHAVQTILATSR